MVEQAGLGTPVPIGVIDVAHATVGIAPPAQPNPARQIKALRNDIRRLKAEFQSRELRKSEDAHAAATRQAQPTDWRYPAVAAVCAIIAVAAWRSALPGFTTFR